jgi:hypothetical protein
MRKLLKKDPTLHVKKLKSLIPALQLLAIRQIHRICWKILSLPSRKMAAKLILTEGMKKSRLPSPNSSTVGKVAARKKGHV